MEELCVPDLKSTHETIDLWIILATLKYDDMMIISKHWKKWVLLVEFLKNWDQYFSIYIPSPPICWRCTAVMYIQRKQQTN